MLKDVRMIIKVGDSKLDIYMTYTLRHLLLNTVKFIDKIIAKGTHKKKVFFLVVGPLRFYPNGYTNGLVVHATFFYVCLPLVYQISFYKDNFKSLNPKILRIY